MTFVTLDKKSWGTSPTIEVKPFYEMRRKGADMEYRIYIELAPITGSSWFGYPIYLDISLDGKKKVSATLKNASPSQWSSAIKYTSEWFTITNKTTGTTSLSLRVYSGSGSSRDTTYTYSLPISPAGSIFDTITGDTIGSAITINITQYSETFTHSLWYSFGSKTWQGIASGVKTSQNFTPPLSLCSEIPNATSGQMTLILRTYEGNNQIGSDVYQTINVKVPQKVIPTIGDITATELVSDINTKAGVFIQGLSKLKISINNAKGTYGSTIKAYKLSFDGNSYSKQISEIGYIAGSGKIKATAEVTDSRGRKSDPFELEINVVAYSPPKFSKTPSAERQDSATDVLVNASGVATSIKNGNTEKNFLKLYILYKKTSSSYFPSISDTYLVDTTGLSFSDITKILSNIDVRSSYDIRVLLVDNFKQTYWDLELGTEIVVGDLNPLGWGIGKYHEKGMLDVAGDIYMNDKLVAYAEHEHNQYLTDIPQHSHDYAPKNHTHNYSPLNHTHDYVPISQLKYNTIVNTNSAATSVTWKDGDYNFLIGMFKIGSNSSITEKVIIPVNHTFLVSDNTNEDRYTITLSGTTRTMSRSSGSGTIFAMYGVKVV